MRIIKPMEETYLVPSLELVQTVFTEHSDAEEGRLVRSLVEEIRAKRFYLRSLELIMVETDTDDVIGYVNFSRFHLDGKYEDVLLLLSPVAVKTELQRQHISKALIECGFEKSESNGLQGRHRGGQPHELPQSRLRDLRGSRHHRPRVRGSARTGVPDGEGTGTRRSGGHPRSGLLFRL